MSWIHWVSKLMRYVIRLGGGGGGNKINSGERIMIRTGVLPVLSIPVRPIADLVNFKPLGS